MIRSLTFKTEHRCFGARKKFVFRPGVNVLVGDNGTGKSTVLAAVRAATGTKDPGRGLTMEAFVVDADVGAPVFSWDSERDNLRTQSFFDDDMAAHVSAIFASHGQANLGALNRLFKEIAEVIVTPGTVLLDEPDSGLSLRNVNDLRRAFVKLGLRDWQIICATHHPDLIGAQAKVLDLGRGGRWVRSETYLASAREPLVPETSAGTGGSGPAASAS